MSVISELDHKQKFKSFRKKPDRDTQEIQAM